MHSIHLSPEYREHFDQYGGYSLGQYIASTHGAECEFTVPESVTIPLDGAPTDSSLLAITEEMTDGFGIKKSGPSEAFSTQSIRGVNSSKNSFWDGQDAEVGLQLLKYNIEVAQYSGYRSAVVQRYVRGSKFTIHCYTNRSISELTDETKAILELEEGLPPVIETFSSIPLEDDVATEVIDVMNNASRLRDILGFDLDIEVISSENILYITQLRPIPPDDCLDYSTLTEHAGQIDQFRPSPTHSTLAVNGRWQTGYIHTVDFTKEMEPRVLIKKNPDIEQCDDIIESLELNIPTLVLDPHGGFKITHETKNLPANPALRKHFAYISIYNCFANIQPGDKVRVRSNGDKGALYAS